MRSHHARADTWVSEQTVPGPLDDGDVASVLDDEEGRSAARFTQSRWVGDLAPSAGQRFEHEDFDDEIGVEVGCRS